MPDEPKAPPLTLLTFAPMVDSEFSRLLLSHYGLDWRERDHLFIWVSLLTFLHGGYGRVPLLYGPGVALSGPRPIVARYDPLTPAGHRLIPDDPDLVRQVEADWHTYNDGLALDTARFVYFHLLPLRELMTGIFAAPVPPAEAVRTAEVYPLLAFAFRTLLRLGPDQAAQSLAGIRSVFAQTDARIADGRPFLCGDRLTLGDLALASAAAPLLLPAGYGAKLPAVELMPTTLRHAVRELRQHPTAAFVQRLYAEGMPAARVHEDASQPA
jgi:glutathione S-transferase